MARRIGNGCLDPEDLAQEVLERWTRAAPRLPPTTNPLAWMIVVLRRLAIDQLRHQRVTAPVAADDSRLATAEREPAPWWLELELADVVRVLGELPEPLRGTFRRFAIDGQSYHEIASELQISPATVGVRVLRARRKLRQLLSARHAPTSPDSGEPVT
jgi:RNA polymerase sigma-70 factor (ECF subfamily)